MPTTTPNFGWSVPVSTDLVKDGATAIELLGDSIDTSFVDLLGGTTGQVLTKASGTDLDFSFTTPASGGMTLIQSGNLSGSANIRIQSIPATYKNLQLWIKDVTLTSDEKIALRLNNDSGSNYAQLRTQNGSATVGEINYANAATSFISQYSVDAADNNSFTLVEIFDYANTNTRKMTRMTTNSLIFDTSFQMTSVINGQYLATPSAINEVNIVCAVNYTGGTFELYGVN